ncbi:MAG: copper resistance CopC/CopD family protein [Acidimicrobiales bacterium]
MSRRCGRRCLGGAVLAMVGVAMLVFGPVGVPAAGAHTFLVRTVPAQGERLEVAPREVSLEFSEAFDARGASLTLTVGGRREPLVAERSEGGRVLRADVATDRAGVYVVAWEVVAEDGHQAAGELAFGVGAEAGAIPAARRASAAPEPLRVGAGWLFFVGLALAAGSLGSGWARASTFRPDLYRGGLLVAQVAVVAVWADALVSDEPARQRLLLAATAAGLAVAVPLGRLPRRWPTALAVGAAALAWSGRGHGAVDNGPAGLALDAVHLLAGAVWAGALGLLVVDLRRDGTATDRLAIARRYARLAAVLVAVLAAAGAGSAFLLLDRPSDLWETGYGQTLLVKTTLFLGALAPAAVGRRALALQRTMRLGRVTPVEASLLASVLAATAVLTNIAPPRPAGTAGASLLGPPPIAGPVLRDAGLAGNLTVSVTAGGDQLRVEVFVPGGEPAADATVELEAELPGSRGITLVPRPCGPGCFTQRLALPDGTTRLDVTAHTADWPHGTYQAELDAPPTPPDPVLLADLVARMRAVPTVSFTETTTSGPGSVVTPQTFQLSGSQFVDLEPWAAGTADDIHPLRAQDGLRLYLPGDRIWVTFWLDDQGRIARERIVTMSHEITRADFRYPTP